MNDDYVKERRRANAKQGPKNLGDAVGMGIKDVAGGVFSGLKGIVYDPYRGFKKVRIERSCIWGCSRFSGRHCKTNCGRTRHVNPHIPGDQKHDGGVRR